MLVISAHTSSSQAWENAGCRTLRLRYDELLKRDYDMILTQLSRRDFACVWVDHADPKFFTKSHKVKHVWRNLRVMIDTCVRSGVPVCFISSRHSIWKIPEVKALRDDAVLEVATHRWCHFGVKFCPNADDYASSVTYITLSRPALPSHGCQCDRSVEHVHDLDITREESRRSLRGPAELRFTSALLAAAGLVRTGPALELDRSGTDRPEPNLRPPITPDLEFLANSGVGVGRAPLQRTSRRNH